MRWAQIGFLQETFMRLKICLAAIALLGFIGPAMAQPSSPAEKAQTAKLNSDIAAANTSADAKYQTAKSQYDAEKVKSDEAQKRYREEVNQNETLQQQYQEKLRAYQEAHPQKQ